MFVVDEAPKLAQIHRPFQGYFLSLSMTMRLECSYLP